MIITAIDPGTTKSAFVDFDGTILNYGIIGNDYIRPGMFAGVGYLPDAVVIEKVACMGMAVGADVFETVYWTGRFVERLSRITENIFRVPRIEVKTHICGSARAKDGNIITSIVDRYDQDRKFGSSGKGTVKNKGPLFGISNDVWQALALAITFWETRGYGGKQ